MSAIIAHGVLKRHAFWIVFCEPAFCCGFAREHFEMFGVADVAGGVDIDPDGFHDHRSSRRPLKNGCRTLPSADFALYSISASSSGSTQMPLCAIFFA